MDHKLGQFSRASIRVATVPEKKFGEVTELSY